MPENLKKRGLIWYVVKNIDGTKRVESTHETNLERARRRKDEIVRRWRDEANGIITDHSTVAQWWDEYQRVYTSKKKAPRRDAQLIAPFLLALGRLPLRRITHRDCAHYLSARSSSVSRSTLDREVGFLRAFFQRAIESKLIEENPWDSIDRPGNVPRTRVLSYTEEDQLRGKCSPQFSRWMTFVLGTGLRLAEACAITPDHIRWQEHTLVVPADAAKFGKSRQVPMSVTVEDCLKEQLRVHGKLWNSSGCYYRKELYRYCDALQITGVSPHTLRHTFGTRFIENGGDIYALTRIMGHSSVEVTTKNYVHERHHTLVEAARQIDVFTDRRVGTKADTHPSKPS